MPTDNPTEYSDKEYKILLLISNFCKGSCAMVESCAEDECQLWNIEQIITDNGGKV